MSYSDPCYELAVLFLAEEDDATELDRDSLAQTIQDAIEDWLARRDEARRAAQC